MKVDGFHRVQTKRDNLEKDGLVTLNVREVTKLIRKTV